MSVDQLQTASDPAHDLKSRQGVCVIIAAMNAENTIADAVLSALRQREVQEVVVVDDASTDDTAKAAKHAASGDPRLRIIRVDRNAGPAAARNLAIAQSTAPLIAVLDADDVLLEDRFRHLLAEEHWDLIADNIVFVEDAAWADLTVPAGLRGAKESRALDLSEFVRGNLSRKGRQRGELGFVKPILRRAFLDRHDLAYDPGLRLGEDYDLYVRALAKGARFRILADVGYAARVRAGSLSSRHETSDLRALLEAADRHVVEAATDPDSTRALQALRAQVRGRYLLRAALDKKSRSGIVAALSFALNPPSNALPILTGVLSDKMAALRQPQTNQPTARYLFPLPDEGKTSAPS